MKERIITGVILAILTLWAILSFSLHVFAVVVCIVLLLTSLEWVSSFLSAKKWYYRVGYVVLTLVFAYMIWVYPQSHQIILAVSVIWWIVALIMIRLYSAGIIMRIPISVKFIMGFLVILPAWVAIMMLKRDNVEFLIFVILAVALADSGAYFVGRICGKHKLAPVISPKKTWEGLAGGIFFSVIGSIIFALAVNLNSPMEYVVLVILGILVVFFALFGDLFESMIKREVGIKDSGNILPGHGGLLDRLDSLFIALPLFVFCANLFGFQV
ncbi:CDP-archaeol synthase [Thiotrichales bacterium 19S3-7]|nr:CDP-archaeol synthase [Thiotrichales bacterium 19S3-7]MCF6800823.1 CDP-archaeol synthase [Thiotrichales bacterium 19S3-11]